MILDGIQVIKYNKKNYSLILEKLLEIPWLGVIFKPKSAKTLRKRLGSAAKLLSKAEKNWTLFYL